MKYTPAKLNTTGSSVKFLFFDKPISYGPSNFPTKKRVRSSNLEQDNPISLEASSRKAKSRLAKLIRSNAWMHKNNKGRTYLPQFTTFTFGAEVLNTEISHIIFKRFIKRLNYHLFKNLNKLLYVAVPEYQKDIDYYGNKKINGGRIHYHVLFFNLPYKKSLHKFIDEIWGQGYIWNKSVKGIDQVVRYLIKYVTKDFDNKHIKFKKRYLCSRGLKKPVTLYDEDYVADFYSYLTSQFKCEIKKDSYLHDGRKVEEIELIFPKGFDVSKELPNTPRDVKKWAIKHLGGEIVNG